MKHQFRTVCSSSSLHVRKEHEMRLISKLFPLLPLMNSLATFNAYPCLSDTRIDLSCNCVFVLYISFCIMQCDFDFCWHFVLSKFIWLPFILLRAAFFFVLTYKNVLYDLSIYYVIKCVIIHLVKIRWNAVPFPVAYLAKKYWWFPRGCVPSSRGATMVGAKRENFWNLEL